LSWLPQIIAQAGFRLGRLRIGNGQSARRRDGDLCAFAAARIRVHVLAA
jgi:hypothetical protein